MAFATTINLVVMVKSFRLLFSRIGLAFRKSKPQKQHEIKITKEHEVAVIALLKFGAHIDNVVYKTEKFDCVGMEDVN